MVEENFQKVEVNKEINKVEVNAEEESLLKKMTGKTKKFDFKGIFAPALIIIAIVLAGAATGYQLANKGMPVSTEETELAGGAKMIQGPKEVGIKDEAVFKDTAKGRIEINDSEEITEGSHRLIRPGGLSQTAYLTSSVLDLDQFRGKCVQIWGETFQAQKAAWLMDVGRLKILDSCPEGV
jgi:hypothetical protein